MWFKRSVFDVGLETDSPDWSNSDKLADPLIFAVTDNYGRFYFQNFVCVCLVAGADGVLSIVQKNIKNKLGSPSTEGLNRL